MEQVVVSVKHPTLNDCTFRTCRVVCVAERRKNISVMTEWSLIRAMWPKSEKAGTSQELQRQPSTSKFRATFLNGKEIEVEYTYQRKGLHQDRIKINLQGLLPVFGGIMPPGVMNFNNISDVKDFLKKTPDLRKCSNGIYTPCSDSGPNWDQYGTKCYSDHFHHYCPAHVNAWFKYYLTKTIMLREGDYAGLLEEESNTAYPATGTLPPPTPKYWLRYAQHNGCGFPRKEPGCNFIV